MVLGNLLGADLRGPGEVSAQLLGKDRLIAGRGLHRLLLAPEPPEQTAGRGLFRWCRAGQHRHGVRLHVLDVLEGPQVPDQLVFVARRHQRGEQQDVGHARRDSGDRPIARVHDLDLGMHFGLDELPQQRGLAWIRFEREYQRHVLPTFSP